MEPQTESFGWENRETYHWMTYYFRKDTVKYKEILKKSYYFLTTSSNPDLSSLEFNPDYQSLRLVKTFDTYPKSPKASTKYHLFLIY